MWRLLCLALLAEVSFGLILKTEKKPVILAHDKLKTGTEEKFLRTKIPGRNPHLNKVAPHKITEEIILDPFFDDFDFDNLEEPYYFPGVIIPKEFDYKTFIIQTDNIDHQRKVCILGVHRGISHLADFEKTGIMPQPVHQNKMQMKELVITILGLPVKMDIFEEEEDIRRMEFAMNLPTNRLTPKLWDLERELADFRPVVEKRPQGFQEDNFTKRLRYPIVMEDSPLSGKVDDEVKLRSGRLNRDQVLSKPMATEENYFYPFLHINWGVDYVDLIPRRAKK